MGLRPAMKVTVRQDLKAGYEYGNHSANSRMQELRGLLVTIYRVCNSGRTDEYYKIEEDSAEYSWDPSMFEEREPIPCIVIELKSGEFIIISENRIVDIQHADDLNKITQEVLQNSSRFLG